ncbi:hypothetical protein M404DRAFT_121765 [Pisolithus tinctorius Marx 270]|uniref:Glycosyltransferase 61 catalytic domain-containing protein n=1 Tax=Pisolithus tinctorius Marx 270 TaxID=870435 RepID=A0A0C3PIN7_PISTI|nr:hypothetical protein M404DRAFT_121765 [Pisolithus tinctorius Marx 270]
MLKSVRSLPIRREGVLLGLLLALLLWVSGTNLGVWESRSAGSLYHDFLDVTNPQNGGNNEQWRVRLPWHTKSKRVPQTNVVYHAPGWTIFDNLYVLNGTVYVVTDEPETVPSRETMTSTGIKVENGVEAVKARLPTDREMRIISTEEAGKLFGPTIEVIDGTTWLVNDPPQFITHYYHWSAELFFGFWRTYSSLDPTIPATGRTPLPSLRRVWFAHTDSDHWRDYAHMNEWVLRSTFPSLTSEYLNDWNERAELGRPFILDRVIFSDRAAAMHGEGFLGTGRFAAEAFELPGSQHWWSTIRNNVIKFAGLDEDIHAGITDSPVITYISRQEWGRRMLRKEDHERLVKELYALRDEHGYEVNIVSMDKLSRVEQIRLAARTTIMMGVHGNGLTSLVWMKPSARTTVIEFFYPGGFAHDYEYTARSLGMTYNGFWDNKTFTSTELPRVAYPEGFQGNSIPVDGSAVAKLCRERLNIKSE